MSVALLALSVLLAAPATCPKIADAAPGAPAAKIGGQAITIAEVDKKLAQELCKARLDHAQKVFDLRQQATNQLIDERLLEAEAKKRGMKGTAALEAILAQNVPMPTEAQARQLYEENKERVGGQPFEALRERIMMSLMQEGQQAVRGALVGSLRSANKVEISLQPLRFPVEAKGPAKGPSNAPVTIVVFADFQCPYCSKGANALEAVRRKHEKDVRIVFRDYPLGFHDQAIPSAVAARCAGQQGKFWEAHDKLYAAQRELGPQVYARVAAELRLDLAQYQKCQGDPSMAQAVNEDFAAGNAAGVDGTPAFFINGVRLSGAQPVEAFEAVIGPELARRGKAKK